MIVLLMGVSGSGKTTVGQKLAGRLGWPFFDADHVHPRANILKMARGQPLTDDDRLPWLRTLRGMIEGWLGVGASAVLACSALKQRYRDMLIHAGEPIRVVYLRGDPQIIASRMGGRDHFFKPHLLQSQLEALEEPDSRQALVVDINRSPDELVEHIRRELGV